LSSWGLVKAYCSLLFGAFTGKNKYFYVCVDDKGTRVACYKNDAGDYLSVKSGGVVMNKDGEVLV
jgi:hypothetical protein